MNRFLRIAAFLMGAVLLVGQSTCLADTYVSNIAALITTNTLGKLVTLGGYYNPGDGGGGVLYPTTTTCTVNGGTVFLDGHRHCLTRVKPTNNVREWGAYCDVVAVQPTSTYTATWNPGLVDTHTGNVGALVVSNALLTPPPTPSIPPSGSNPGLPSYIAISQVGGPTLWVNNAGATAGPAMWATRYSALSNGGVNYKRGDLVSFVDTSGVKFSQQIAIVVDTAPGGVIGQWHFLWGGLYDATSVILPATPPDTVFTADAGHSYCSQGCGTGLGQAKGATFTPIWSGWSLLNKQTIFAGGSGYHVGDTITMSESTSDGSVVNGTPAGAPQYPILVVETVDNSGGMGVGAVTSYDWLNFGSYSTLPSSPMLLTSVVSHTIAVMPGSGFKISPVLWTQGPLATTIADVQPDATPGFTDIFPTDVPPAASTLSSMPIQYFYYGHDDNVAINNALNSQTQASIATGNGAAFSLPAACGATVQIALPTDTTPNFVNPSLVGRNFQSTGLYAFAAPLAGRSLSTGTPVLSQVIYGGFPNSFGGGFRDMLVEAMGIPEGFGYYGLAQAWPVPGVTGAYVGPLPLAPPKVLAPTAGDAVELISGKYLRIRNVVVRDGGVGSGNAVYQCGIDESDPSNPPFLGGNGVGNIVMSDSRFEANPLFSGATNSDIALRLGNSCHDSVYTSVTANDGVKADVLEYNGNLFSQLHLGSGAFGSTTLANPLLVFVATGAAANTGFAGVADYGLYAIGNTSLDQTVCEIANHACIRLAVSPGSGSSNPGQVTDTQMQCGSLQSVPPNYEAIELGAGIVNTTVSGTSAAARCHVPATQMIVADGAIDATTSLCNNPGSPVVYCGGGGSGFASGRYYTQLSLGYSSAASVNGTPTSTPLYAMPFINPGGGPISQIGIQVSGTGTMGQCELGIYSSVAGAPRTLLLDAGPVTVLGTTTGPLTITGLNFFIQPGTLYFLAAACNVTVPVWGTANTNGLIGLLMGEANFTDFGATSVSGSWSAFTANQLPSTFPTLSYATVANSTPWPNVYVGP